MKSAILGFIAALLLHGGVILFGGALLFTDEEASERAPAREVELFAATEESPADDPKRKDEEREKRPVEEKPEEEIAEQNERPPDVRELFDAEAQPASPTDSVARLEALSLGALESALSGAGGGGGDSFGGGVSLASGGRIGGTGSSVATRGEDEDPLSRVFDVTDLDQRARPVFQTPPNYPSELRQRRIGGTVYVLFVVDEQGKVVAPRVERSVHEGLDRAAVDAIRHWKFEPAVRSGEKVRSKLRIPIRFEYSG